YGGLILRPIAEPPPPGQAPQDSKCPEQQKNMPPVCHSLTFNDCRVEESQYHPASDAASEATCHPHHALRPAALRERKPVVECTSDVWVGPGLAHAEQEPHAQHRYEAQPGQRGDGDDQARQCREC